MSDSNMQSLSGLVVGTAGHIDHGKTSLVYALTGMDTDRLKEEKQRGISIDLGFAEMELPGGLKISFVDVPGHERFVRNMLAGASGMEAVLLIVAANESVMPQTREHLEICKLLGLQHGIVVLTKCDVVDAPQIAQTRADVRNLVAESFLADAPIAEVSAISGAGMERLTGLLAAMARKQTARNRNGVMRLPIDRSFAVKGFGTVVTGTLQAGVVKVGDALDLNPQKVRVRARSLQTQHVATTEACAGQRVAINVSGIEQHEIKRGQVLTAPDTLTASRLLDVELRWLEMNALPANRELFILHIGTSEVSARVRLHTGSEDSTLYARLYLKEDVVAVPGDRFVIRRPSPAGTVGGGAVIDAFPLWRRNRVKTMARLRLLTTSNSAQRLALLVNETSAGLRLADLVRLTGNSKSQVQAEISANKSLILAGDDRVISQQWLEQQRGRLLKWLQEFHRTNPNAPGAPLSAARMELDPVLASIVTKNFEGVSTKGDVIALTTHKPQFNQQETAVLEKLEYLFRAAGFQPPPVAETIASSGADAKKARALLELLIKSNRLVRLPDDLIFHADVIAHIRKSLSQHKGRRFSVADFKTWTNMSRKFAIPMLEYLDQQRVTRREGENRIVL